MHRQLHVLVGGGTGFVGKHLVSCLKSSGAKVKVITRNPKGPDQVSWSSIKDDGLPKETASVVNLAGRGILDIRPWSQHYKKEVYDSRIETNKILVDAIHKSTQKPQSFITMSGVAYYPTNDERIFDENWLQPESTANNFLMDLARDWEKAGELDSNIAPSTRRVITRAAVVIGPGGGMLQNLHPSFSIGLGATLGNGAQWMPWIHATDLANIISFAISNDHVSGVVNAVAPELVTNKQFKTAYL